MLAVMYVEPAIVGSCVVYEPLGRDVDRHVDQYVGRYVARCSTDTSVDIAADTRPIF